MRLKDTLTFLRYHIQLFSMTVIQWYSSHLKLTTLQYFQYFLCANSQLHGQVQGLIWRDYGRFWENVLVGAYLECPGRRSGTAAIDVYHIVVWNGEGGRWRERERRKQRQEKGGDLRTFIRWRRETAPEEWLLVLLVERFIVHRHPGIHILSTNHRFCSVTYWRLATVTAWTETRKHAR